MKFVKTLQQTQILSSFLVQTGGERKILKVFEASALQSYNLHKTIQYNEYVLTNASEKVFPEYFLPVNTSEKESKIIFLEDFYQQTLDDYLFQNQLTEKQALKIFSQILKSVYSLYSDDLVHRNLRPQHFALHKGTWKLRSLVWTDQYCGVRSEYTLDPRYQAPEEYEARQNTQLDICQIIAWNLGSILLDMITGSHCLGTQKQQTKFRNEKNPLLAVGCYKKISAETQKYLVGMLHHDPNQRTKLGSIFENPYFSEQVSCHFKKSKMKGNDLKVSMQKDFVAQKILQRTTLRDTLARSSNDNIFSNNQLLKIDEDLSKTQLLMSKKRESQMRQSSQIIDDDVYFDKLNLVTRLQRKKQAGLGQQKSRIQNESEIANVLKIYKTMTDRSLLLVVSAQKIQQIPFNDKFKSEFMLMMKFSVYYAALIELSRMIRMVNLNKNIFHVSEDLFSDMISTSQFDAFRSEINETLISLQLIFEDTAKQLQSLSSGQRNFMKDQQMVKYIKQRNPREKVFADIKKNYRLILKKAYDIISVFYNQTMKEEYCRLSLYTLFSMTVDKLYIQADLEDNFSFFIQWNSLKSTRKLVVDDEKFVYVSVCQLQKYLDEAPIKTLIAHSKKILGKYFKI